MFSPYYARARAIGHGDPMQHCAINVALYGRGGTRWTMTERGQRAVSASPAGFRVGRSSLHWNGHALRIDLDEFTVPLPRRVRGTVRLTPSQVHATEYALDDRARHHWHPIAPVARIEVELERPGLRWTGSAYWDSNHGDEALEHAFAGWTWSRAECPGGTTVLYDTAPRAGRARTLALRFNEDGRVRALTAPPVAVLPATFWRVQRSTRADEGTHPRVITTFEDTPFYARSLLETRLYGESVRAIHEALSLDRFRAAWVRALLPFRMPRTDRLL